MGQHGQRDVPIPALPVAHFVVVQPAFALSCLQGWFDQPALSSHSDQRCKRVFPGGSVTQIVSALWLLFDAAPHQKRPRPTILWVSYGFMIHSLPIILPNAVTFFLSAPLLIMKLRYRERIEGIKTKVV